MLLIHFITSKKHIYETRRSRVSSINKNLLILIGLLIYNKTSYCIKVAEVQVEKIILNNEVDDEDSLSLLKNLSKFV